MRMGNAMRVMKVLKVKIPKILRKEKTKQDEQSNNKILAKRKLNAIQKCPKSPKPIHI